MTKITIAIIASLLAGFSVGAYVLQRSDESDANVAAVAGPVVVEGEERRLQTLERIVREEREARLVLEDQLLAVLDQLEKLELSPESEALRRQARSLQSANITASNRNEGRDIAAVMQKYQDRRVAALVDGGFSEDEARQLLKTESRAQYQALLSNHEARRSGDVIDVFAGAQNPQAILRKDLGDAEYERYLTAQGQPTSVQVANVLSGSPGSNAGLQPGDRVVSYNGERTFSMLELRQLTLQGTPGENIVVEIDRDGVRMVLSIPRGPIGMNGSGATVGGRGRWGG